MQIKTADTEHGYQAGTDGWLSTAEAREYASVSVKTLERWAKAGHIRRSRVNAKMVRYCKRSLQEWFAKHEQ